MSTTPIVIEPIVIAVAAFVASFTIGGLVAATMGQANTNRIVFGMTRLHTASAEWHHGHLEEMSRSTRRQGRWLFGGLMLGLALAAMALIFGWTITFPAS